MQRAVSEVSASETQAATSAYALGRAQWTFDAKCQKCLCVTFDKSNKTHPYANILNERIEGYSLYPRDFIFSLPEPKAYFGEKVIFGSYFDKEHYPGLDIIRNIPDDEMKVLSKIKDKSTADG